MSNFKLTEAYRNLLGRYDGVRVGRIRCHPSGDDSVMFQATNPASLVRLASCAENANVSICVWSNSQGFIDQPGTEFDDSPWYNIRADGDPPDTDYPNTTSEGFCVRMLFDLVRIGALDQSEGDRLLASWGWPLDE
jgi:hypothetical protein